MEIKLPFSNRTLEITFYYSNLAALRAGCAGCSLANLFLEIERKDISKKVLSGFSKHPLTSRNWFLVPGVHFLCIPSLLEDLTSGEYSGKIWTAYPQIAKFHLPELQRNAIENSERKGRIEYNVAGKIFFRPPVVLSFKGHSVMYNGEYCVDNGSIKKSQKILDETRSILEVIPSQ